MKNPEGHTFEIDDFPVDAVDVAVVYCVSAVKNTPPDDLDPLWNCVDADALRDLVEREATGRPPRRTEVTFYYEGFTCTVSNRGRIHLEPESAFVRGGHGPAVGSTSRP